MRVSVRTRLPTALCVAALSLISLAAQQPQAPVLTSRTWLVPIDVRVVKVPVKALVKTVKVIVYDYASDRLGSATRIVG